MIDWHIPCKITASDINSACFLDFTAGIDPIAIAVEDDTEKVYRVVKFTSCSVLPILRIECAEIEVLQEFMINEDFIIVIEPIHHIDRKEKLLCGGKISAIIVLRHND